MVLFKIYLVKIYIYIFKYDYAYLNKYSIQINIITKINYLIFI